MYRSSWLLTAVFVGTIIPAIQPVSFAKAANEIETIAKAATVEIKLRQNSSVGSGVIINKKGNLYTLVTNRHVVCGNTMCSALPSNEKYDLGLVDGQRYQVTKPSIKLLGDDLDLAIVQFRSNHNYAVAKVDLSGSLKANEQVYTAGFPFEYPGFAFGIGETKAAVHKRLIDDNGGYTIVYTAFTSPGMSGGGVFNQNGQLVAIHGQGDRFRENTESTSLRVGNKTGYNRGIPVRWLEQGLIGTGINLGNERSINNIRVAKKESSQSADEYFIAGFNKFINPGDDVKTGKQQAIQKLSKAIKLNPKYAEAYFMRAETYEQLQEFQKSLADFDQAIAINPQLFYAYCNRGNLKATRLNNLQGALADYNQSIILEPNYAITYNNRGNLKSELNDLKGALADFDRAIVLKPKESGFYSNRGLFKNEKLNDFPGALVDFNQAISLNANNSGAYYNRANLKKDKLSDIAGALADYNQAISIDPNNPSIYTNRGNLKAERLNDPNGALADYNQSIAFNSRNASAYNNRGTLKHMKLNDFPGALADFDRAININPNFFEAFYNRGLLKHVRLKNFKGALADYSQAISLNPKLFYAYGSRAALKYESLNDKAGAIKDIRQAAKLAKEVGNKQYSQWAIGFLREMGGSE
jgi:tetratricopeptide (TPR) repeat protein